MRRYVSSSTRAIHDRLAIWPPSASREFIARSRASGAGGTYQIVTPPAAVGPLVPQNPLSTRITLAPLAAAAHAAQVPAGPPPITRTSAMSPSVSRTLALFRSLAIPGSYFVGREMEQRVLQRDVQKCTPTVFRLNFNQTATIQVFSEAIFCSATLSIVNFDGIVAVTSRDLPPKR